jgi:hypothetical protein
MSYSLKSIVLCGLGLLLFGCSTTPKVGTPEATVKIQKKIAEKKIEAAEEIVKTIPEWCNDMPVSDVAIYACGVGNSSDLNMARNRAMLDAKRVLADMVNSEIVSRMEDFLKSTGTGNNEQVKQASEIITKNITAEASLVGYRQTKAETQNIESKFQHYVLLEYPIGMANKALLAQIKEDEILSTQTDADKAMAELEAEIEKRRNR